MPNDNSSSSFEKIFTYVKYAAGAAIFFYAYLYIIGYLYLYSYFDHWRLSALRLGFSIVDFATAAIYPIILILISTILFLPMGYILIISNSRSEIKAKKKASKFASVFFIYILIPLIGVLLIVINLQNIKSIFNWLNLIIVIGIISYIAGVAIGEYRGGKKKIFVHVLIVIALLYLLLVPIFSLNAGGSFASVYWKYYYNPLKTYPDKLSNVIVYSRDTIDDFEIFRTGSNKYERLLELEFKNDIYYFVADLETFTKTSESLSANYSKNIDQLEKEVDKLIAEAESGTNLIKNDNTANMIKEAGKQLEELNIVGAVASREAKLNEIKGQLDKTKEILSRSGVQSKKNMELLNKAQELNDKAKQESVRWSEMITISKINSHSVFAIGKDRISKIIYIN